MRVLKESFECNEYSVISAAKLSYCYRKIKGLKGNASQRAHDSPRFMIWKGVSQCMKRKHHTHSRVSSTHHKWDKDRHQQMVQKWEVFSFNKTPNGFSLVSCVQLWKSVKNAYEMLAYVIESKVKECKREEQIFKIVDWDQHKNFMSPQIILHKVVNLYKIWKKQIFQIPEK